MLKRKIIRYKENEKYSYRLRNRTMIHIHKCRNRRTKIK